MMEDNYFKKEIKSVFQNANWQELCDLFRDLYDPLSLREFRGYVESMEIDDYARRHWLSSNDKKGFGELMVSCAGKEWNSFKIKFYDSDDKKRFLELNINCNNNEIDLVGSLDNKEKLDNTFSRIVNILNVKINGKNDFKNKFYNKWWFKFLLVSILAPIIVGLVLLYFPNKSSNRQANNLQNSSVNDIKESDIAGDIVGRDKITYQTIIPSSTDQMNIDRQSKIKISKVKVNRIIEDLSSEINEIKKEYFKESKRIANDFSSRNIYSSGLHIKAQRDSAISSKKMVEKLLIKAHRDIGDVLLGDFRGTNLAEMDEFSEEDKSLSKLEENIIPLFYKQLEEAVKSWEIRIFGTINIIKDFKL